jgi:hypothetical protein
MNEGKKKDIRLAKQWPATKVRGCLGRKDRAQLVRFLADRHRERFFEPIEYITKAKGNEQGFGFSVMALCALLIETIQSYRDGLPTTDRGELGHLKKLKSVPTAYQIPDDLKVDGTEEFRRFFVRYRDDFPGIRPAAFYRKVRNGILHQGQTKGSWTLRKRGSIVCDPTNKIIYRDQFAQRLRLCFDRYLEELEAHAWNQPIWTNAARKIWWLIRLSR